MLDAAAASIVMHHLMDMGSHNQMCHPQMNLTLHVLIVLGKTSALTVSALATFAQKLVTLTRTVIAMHASFRAL
jgi:hypothetical protein